MWENEKNAGYLLFLLCFNAIKDKQLDINITLSSSNTLNSVTTKILLFGTEYDIQIVELGQFMGLDTTSAEFDFNSK